MSNPPESSTHGGRPGPPAGPDAGRPRHDPELRSGHARLHGHRAAALRPVVAALVLIPLVAGAVLWVFAWPAARTAPNDLPVGVAGPQQAVAELRQALEAAPGTFAVHDYPDADAAAAAVGDREVYGAFVAGQRPEVLVASAGGPLVAQLLTDLAARLLPGEGAPTVTDVVPAPADDPRGAAFAAGVLPLVLAGVITGVVLSALGARRGRLLATLVAAALVTGAGCAALARSWLSVLAGDGSWPLVAAALSLVVLAVAATVAGCVSLIGPPGIGVATLLLVLLGNPFSGAATAPELLPTPAGPIGGLLPPGAGASLLRSAAYFDGDGAAGPLLVLGAWTTAGLAAVLLGRRGIGRVARPA